MNSKILYFTLLFSVAGLLAGQAQVTLVKNATSSAKIVVTTSKKADWQAAGLMQLFVKRISGVQLPIASGEAAKKGDIIIGNGGENAQFLTPELKEDGFLITTVPNKLHIVSGGDKGSIYGVVTLLERYLGVSYWSENEYSLTTNKTITLPSLHILENAAFRYRQTQNYALRNDSVYKMWFRLEEPREVFAGGYWVHTFNRLLPSSVYGKAHPEYYAFFNGKRNPGQESQWCLSNPEVFEIVSQRIDSIFKANPDKNIISVSQNDGNQTHCTCDNCRKIDEYEGALSGSVIHFLNKLAARFPDKQFSTLAYSYTMKPPRHIKPLPNVNIMLCNIDCEREVSLTENQSGREFVRAMEGWSKISDNIFVWDYGINFNNYIAPFPNFHILADNIRLFHAHNATMHLSQIASVRGGDFAEMRSYMVSKLMWNPQADTDSLTQTFLHGYYGKAAPFIYQYIKIMEGALIGSGKRLWIYDSPVSHKDGMLKPALMRRYNALFDKAEMAVGNDSVLLNRTRRTQLPLLYSELEIARTQKGNDTEDISRKLELFEKRTREMNVEIFNERRNTTKEYCSIYRTRYMPHKEKNLAAGAKIDFLTPPAEKYVDLSKKALTDELFGGATYVESWIGWQGCDASFVIDLGEEKSLSSIEADFLHQTGAWVLLPKKVVYSLSDNGQEFQEAGSYDLAEDKSHQIKFVGVKHSSPAPVKARYIRVEITATKTCPEWHNGVGNPCWLYLDEVTVN